MTHTVPAFPFFLPTQERQLSPREHEVVALIVSNEASELRGQLNGLRVVGRCGCGACPTVFFQPHVAEEREHELASYAGKDATGGIVGVLLWQKNGQLSQLEFYSVDGHDPWAIPEVGTLERF